MCTIACLCYIGNLHGLATRPANTQSLCCFQYNRLLLLYIKNVCLCLFLCISRRAHFIIARSIISPKQSTLAIYGLSSLCCSWWCYRLPLLLLFLLLLMILSLVRYRYRIFDIIHAHTHTYYFAIIWQNIKLNVWQRCCEIPKSVLSVDSIEPAPIHLFGQLATEPHG